MSNLFKKPETRDSGLEREPVVPATPVAGSSEGEDSELKHRYQSLPILRYQLGRFQFDSGYLLLNQADAEEFETLLKGQPIQEQIRVQKVSLEIAQPVAPAMIQGVDHTGNAPEAPSGEQKA